MLIEGYVLNQRYQILRVLSDKGGMGVIYQATDLSFNNTVVIKHSRFTEQFLKQQHPAMPPDDLRSHAEYLRKAFEREARLVRGLKHHALPTVIDYFTTGDGHQFFVMDFIPGKDFGELLEERLRQNQGPFPLAQVLDWADQLLDVLNYLHTHYESPIIHRDLKPSNLKLTPDGRIALLDFGLAKGATPGMSVISASIHGYTLQYAPLEQIRGKGTSVRSDLYSLAVTLHHLLSGAVPPSAVDRVTEMTSGEADPLRSLHEINPQIPAVISEVIQRAAALNPNERYATAAEMRETLRRASKFEPVHSTGKLLSLPAKPIIIEPSTKPATIAAISRILINLRPSSKLDEVGKKAFQVEPKEHPDSLASLQLYFVEPRQRKQFLLWYNSLSVVGAWSGLLVAGFIKQRLEQNHDPVDVPYWYDGLEATMWAVFLVNAVVGLQQAILRKYLSDKWIWLLAHTPIWVGFPVLWEFTSNYRSGISDSYDELLGLIIPNLILSFAGLVLIYKITKSWFKATMIGPAAVFLALGSFWLLRSYTFPVSIGRIFSLPPRISGDVVLSIIGAALVLGFVQSTCFVLFQRGIHQ